MHRPIGYTPTDEEIEYIKHDTEIMARVLKEFHKEGMSSLTSASDSFKAYKKTMTKKTFAELFPVLDKEIDDYVRKSYLGGLCIVNKNIKIFYYVTVNVTIKLDVSIQDGERIICIWRPY